MTKTIDAWKNIAPLPKPQCFGCSVCADICPVNCIEMIFDFEGFLYPKVDDEKCIDCGKCISACPALNSSRKTQPVNPPNFNYGYINDDRSRHQSSSGGIFSLLANHTLSQGGVVYGAMYDFEHMSVIHARAASESEIQPMRKSKYVQSDSDTIYSHVKQDLNAGKPVLFTGTPCQVEGLNLFLGKEFENLLTCDIICHGVPSPGLFKSHFTLIKNQTKTPVTNIDFRTKAKGWGSFLNFYLMIKTETKQRLIYAPLDAFYALFLANLSLRPVCYQCKFANLDRKSDLTIGDYWSVKQHSPELFDGKGTSLILVNSKKGEKTLSLLGRKATIQPIQPPQPLPHNLVQPTERPKQREKFFERISLDEWHKYRTRWHLFAILSLVKDKLTNFAKRLG